MAGALHDHKSGKTRPGAGHARTAATSGPGSADSRPTLDQEPATPTRMLARYAAAEVAGWLQSKGHFAAARLFADPTSRVAKAWDADTQSRGVLIDLLLSLVVH